MATYEVTSPDGQTYEVNAPDNATEAQVLAYAKNQFAKQDKQPQQQKERTNTEEILRQLGLTARYGIEGVGGLVDLASSPFRAGINLMLPESKQLRQNAVSSIADTIGLPKPETKQQRIIGDVSRTLAAGGGSIGVAKAMVPLTTGVTRGVMQTLTAAPGSQAISATGAGLGSGIAREKGASPLAQAGAGLFGSIAAPASVSAARYTGKQIGDVSALIGASLGSERGVKRLSSDAAKMLAGDDVERVKYALSRPTEYVPGAKPTVAEAIAEQTIGKPQQFGGRTMRMQKTLSGVVGAEDVLPNVAREQKTGIENYRKALESKLGPRREAILTSVNKSGGVDPAPVFSAIDNELASPKITDFAKNALLAAKQNIANKVNAETGKIDAQAIYTSRMEMNQAVRGSIESKGIQWDKKQAGILDRIVQKSIDDAIEYSGGKGWKQAYMKPYAKGFENIRAHEARAKEVKEITKGIQKVSPAEIISGEAPKLPTLLSRPMMAINFALKTILGDANTPVAKELARRMANPEEYAKLIALPIGHPTRTLVDKITTVAKSTLAQQSAQQGQEQ